jgi:hypothetical protein
MSERSRSRAGTEGVGGRRPVIRRDGDGDIEAGREQRDVRRQFDVVRPGRFARPAVPELDDVGKAELPRMPGRGGRSYGAQEGGRLV